MESLNLKYKAQLFICTNQKQNGESCGLKNAEKMQKILKEWVKADPNLRDKIKITKSGCLSQCEKGIAAVIYPKQEWLINISESDLEALKQKLLQSL